MSIINETKKYLHMLVKMLVFILILCVFKLIESFFEVRRMPEVYVTSYLVFAYFILGRLFSEKKEKLMIVIYILLDTAVLGYFMKTDKNYGRYLLFFFILSVIVILIYNYFNKYERIDKKRRFLIFLIPCYLLFIKLIFAITYVYLHIDEYNIFSLWFL